MARLPYPDLERPETRDLVDAVVAERGKVFNLYTMLGRDQTAARISR